MRQAIQQEKPEKKERDERYGYRVWLMGQSRESLLRKNWDSEKVKLMFLINLAKYACNEVLQRQLIDETKGCASTWQWSKWNGLIQTLIRQKVSEGLDFEQLLVQYEAIKASQVQAELDGNANAEEQQSDGSDSIKGLDDDSADERK